MEVAASAARALDDDEDDDVEAEAELPPLAITQLIDLVPAVRTSLDGTRPRSSLDGSRPRTSFEDTPLLAVSGGRVHQVEEDTAVAQPTLRKRRRSFFDRLLIPAKHRAEPSFRDDVVQACKTLSLAVFGGGVFPVPYAFRLLGPGRGTALALWVALLNDYTSVLLVRAAAKGRPAGVFGAASAEEERAAGSSCGDAAANVAADFEELASASGGRVLKVTAQMALCVLLMGSMCSNLAVIVEASSRVIASGSSPLAHTKGILAMPLGRSQTIATSSVGGALCMLLVLALIITPLCATRQMNTLHHVAGGGAVLLSSLLIAVVAASMSSSAAGWAAASSPAARVPGASASQAFVVLSFAFFVQPMLLPLLRELSESSQEQRRASQLEDIIACSAAVGRPCGSRAGDPASKAAAPQEVTPSPADRLRAAAVLEAALHVTMVIAFVVYTLLGVCGVVAFGGDTSEDILLNFDGAPGVVLDAGMVLYLAVCFAPTCHALRSVVYGLLDSAFGTSQPPAAAPSDDESGLSPFVQDPRHWKHHLRRVAFLNGSAAAVALFVPRSETLFAITGAVGVSVVCYIFPLLMHIRLVRYTGLDESTKAMPPSLPSDAVLLQDMSPKTRTALLMPATSSSLLRGGSFALRWLNAWALPMVAVGVCSWLSISGLQNTLQHG